VRLQRHTVQIMTWNIHGAVGRNPRFDLMRVVEVIKRVDPDIIALQEVDSRRRANCDDTFRLLHQLLGEHGVGAKSITGADGDYGQLLISRWPITASEVHDISYPEREPRRAIKAEVDTPAGPLRVVATHLGLSTHERRSQARKLLDIAGRTPTTTVVLGDFNDWFWAGSVRAALARELPGRTRYRTFPSWLPLLRLDRIYCRPARALLASRAETLARHVSDHIGVVAEIKPRS
jgi:endonuclease/exonuclease/phosphatase family metal-dependent hydrolase